MTNDESNSNDKARRRTDVKTESRISNTARHCEWPFSFRYSDFGFLSSFVIRHSDFVLPPHFGLAQLLQKKFFERGVGRSGEKINAARLAIFAQTLDEVLDRLLIVFHPVTAKGHFLNSTRFGIHQAQIAERGGTQFLRREDLHKVHLEAAANEGIQSGL